MTKSLLKNEDFNNRFKIYVVILQTSVQQIRIFHANRTEIEHQEEKDNGR